MVSSILPKNEGNSLSWASSVLSEFCSYWGKHNLLSRLSDLYQNDLKIANFDQWSKNRGKKMIFGIFFLTLNPFSCLTYGKTPRTNANPDERLLDTIVWRHSKASGKTHHVLVINITSSGTYRALALLIDTFWGGQGQLNFSPTYVAKTRATLVTYVGEKLNWRCPPQNVSMCNAKAQ